jgi:carboxymethylenebutenolidase
MLLEESTVTLTTESGPMQTYVYRPLAPGRHPGLVFFSEIFQRTGPIHRAAAIMAGHGFTVCVPEIFHELLPAGTVLAYDKAGTDIGNAHKIGKSVASYDSDSRAVVDHLLARDDSSGAVHAMGVCIGGHLAFRCALDPRVKSAACFYATDLHKGSFGKGGDDSLARAGEIRGELMMTWGRQDPHVDDEGRAKILLALTEKKVRFTWHEWNAQHAFMRDEGPRYDPALALTSYRLAVDLFSR